jgi:hypothetical protein
MPQPPQVADTAPDEPFLTGDDELHLVTYLRLLDADAEGADWREVASIVLEIDPEKKPQRVSASGRAISREQVDDRDRISTSPKRRGAELGYNALGHRRGAAPDARDSAAAEEGEG